MLVDTGFAEHPTAGTQELLGIGQDTAQVGEAFLGRDERGLRIELADFRVGLGDFGFGEIRGIRDDEVVSVGDRGEPIGLREVDALSQVALRGVLAGEGEGVSRTIDRVDFPERTLSGEGQRNGAGARTEIEHADGLIFRKQGDREVDEFFGLRTRDQRALIGFEDQVAELHLTDDVLERLAITAADREVAQALHFVVVEQPFELQIKVEALQAQAGGEKMLGLHARLLQALARKEFRGLLQRVEEVLHQRAAARVRRSL